MASYIRQSTFSDGDLITAELFNNEYNQLVAVFDNATGHKHDGTVGEGPVISIIGDAGLTTPLNKILIDTTNDHIEFWVDVSGTSTQQLYIADGAIVPVTDNDIDLGTNSLQFKDLYINGTANIDNLAADSATLTTADINGGNIDGTVIGATTAAAGTFTTIDASGNVVISGNLTVSGTTTSVNSNEVNIGDNILVLNSDETGTPSQNAGIEIERGTSTNVSLLWNESNDYWTFGSNDLNFPDGSKAIFGTGSDLEIYHEAGVGSWIKEVGAGDLNIQAHDNLRLQNTASENYLKADSDGAVTLYYDNAAKIATTSTGIDVTGTVVSDGFTVDATGSLAPNSGNLELSSSNTGIIYDAQNGYHTFKNNGTNSLQINGGTNHVNIVSGNLELNGSTTITNNKTAYLKGVYVSDAQPTLRLLDTDATNQYTDFFMSASYALFQNRNNTANGGFIFRGSNGSANTEYMRIDPSGNVLVGTTSASIAGSSTETGVNANAIGALVASRTSGASGFFNRLSTDGTIVEFRKNGSTVGSIGTVAGYLGLASGDTGLLFRAAYDDILPYSSTANSAIDNTIDLGDPSFGFKDLYLSGTANFGSLSDGTITITGFVDEDNMASNSATLLPTQQSVKAYVDAQISSAGGNGISFEDNEKAQFGDGNDLQIYHDGNTSYILDDGDGDLQLRSNNRIVIAKSPFEYMADFNVDGAVDLYYDNSKKLATTSTGIDVTGNIEVGDSHLIGDDSFDNLALVSSSGENIIVGASNDIYFTTGATSLSSTGTTKLIVKDSGNIGIGTTAPNSRLEVLQTVTNGDGASLRVINDGSGIGTGQTASLVIGRNFEERNFKIQSSSTLNYGSKPDLIFSTNQAEGGSSTHTEVLRIKNDGKVGIGTNAPADELHVNGSGDTTVRVTTSSTSLEPKLVFVDGSGDYASLEKVNRDIKIKAFNTDVAYFTNGGNVGIGTSSPQNNLHVNAGTGGGVTLEANANVDIDFRYRSGGVNKYNVAYDASEGSLIWYDNTANATRMVLNSSGNVGIGTSSPSTNRRLHVAGVAVKNAKFERTANAKSHIEFSDTTTTVEPSLGSYGNNLTFDTNFQERARIDSSGNFGIGTTSPSATLEVAKGSEGDYLIVGGDNSSNGRALVFTSSTATSNGALHTIRAQSGNGEIAFSTGTSEALRIDSSQNVGIGTSSPSSISNYKILEVQGDTTTTGGIYYTSSSDNSQKAHYYIGGGVGYLGTQTNHPFAFTTNNTERARIDSSGNLLVGKTSANIATVGFEATPSSIFQANASTADGKVAHTFNRKTSDGDVITFRKDGTAVGSIGVQSNTIYIDGGSGSTGLYFGSSNIYPRDNGAEVDNAVVIGHASYRFKDLYLSGTANTVTINTAGPTGTGNGIVMAASGWPYKGRIGMNGTSGGKQYWTANYNLNTSSVDSASYYSTYIENSAQNGIIAFGTSSAVNTAPSERARIDSSGNFGIGTSSPDGDLEVVASTTVSGASDSVNNVLIGLQSTNRPTIILDTADTTYTNRTWNITNVGSAGTLRIGRNGLDVMSLKNDGKVGIGIDSPNEILHVHKSTTPRILLTDATTGTTSGSDGMFLGIAGDQGLNIWNYENTYTRFAVNNDEKMRITSSGNVGIGTDSPARQFHVHDASASYLHLTNNTTGSTGSDGASISMAGTSLQISNRENGVLQMYTNGTERARIDSSGNAIFTKSGGAYLQLKDATAVRGAINVETSDGLVFTTGSSFAERMRIDSSGNLLVGQTSQSPNTVGISLNNNGNISAKRDGGIVALFNRATSDGEIISIRKDNTTVGSIGAYNSATAILSGSAASYSGLYLNTNKIEPVGNNFGSEIRADNTIDIGSSTYKFKDLHLSGTGYIANAQLEGSAPQLSFKMTSTGNTNLFAKVETENSNEASFNILGTPSYGGTATETFSTSYTTTKFFSNGSERARIDSNGNFGIGTSSPDRKLTVSGTLGIGIDDYIVHNGDSNSFFGFNGLDSFKVRTGGGDRLVIGNDDSNFNTNLGIGTSSPSSLLHLSSSAPVLTVTSTSGTGGTHTIKATGINGDALQITAENDIYLNGDNIYFRKADETQHMRLTSTGNLGIGTSSPSGLLSLEKGTRTLDVKLETSPASGDVGVQFRAGASDYLGIAAGGSGTGIVIDDSNNVGIGTSSPGEKLTVSGNTLTYGSTGNVGAGASYFLGNSQNSRDIALTRVGSATLGIGYYSGGWQESARFDSSGNFLVGKTSTSVATVGAKIAPTGEITATVSGDKTLTLNRTTSDGDVVQFRRDNTAVGSIGVGSTNVALRIGVDEASAINNSFIEFRVDGSQKAQLNSQGNFYVGTTTGQTSAGNINTRAAFNGDVFTNGVRFNGSTDEATNTVPFYKLWLDGLDLMIGSTTIETGATSDRRLKENIENIPNAIEKVKLLNGVTFNYKKKPNVKEAGFIAQDVEKALPEAVYTAYEDGEEVLALKYNRITSVLVEAMKEQQEQIESLKSEIANLKGEKNGN